MRYGGETGKSVSWGERVKIQDICSMLVFITLQEPWKSVVTGLNGQLTDAQIQKQIQTQYPNDRLNDKI